MAEPKSGTQKAAILMALLGEESAASVLKHLEQDEVRRITLELAKIKMLDPSAHAAVLEEFLDLIRQARGLEMAGPPLARKLLARTRPDDVDAMLQEIEPRRVKDHDEEQPHVQAPELPDALLSAPARRLALLLTDEPPQTVALVLAHLPPRKAGRVMQEFDQPRRIEITRRMASMSEVRPDVVTRVGAVLEQRLAALTEDPLVPMNGLTAAADRLTGLGRAAGQEILQALQEQQPDLATQLRDMLFTFDMLRALSPRDIQEVLKQVERAQLALALKGADPEMQQLFLAGMSERAAQMLQEEMEFLGAPRVQEIEAAQRQMIDLVLKLEREGTITIEEAAVATG